MTSSALFHYILAFTVLFASSFAVFHGSEHITFEPSHALIDGIDHHSVHSESEHNHVIGAHSNQVNHSIESLCEACLVLSNLAAYSFGYHALEISAEEPKHKLFVSIRSNKHLYQTYLSRAPPSNA